MCGAEEKLFKAEVEGTILEVCKNCAKFGKIIGPVKEGERKKEEREKKIERRVMPERELMQLINPDYSEIIKKKREKLGLKQEELAKKIAEKESLIHKIESGQFEPGMDLARKLEKFLNIKLIEQHEEVKIDLGEKRGGPATLGDVVVIKKKK